MKADRPSRTAAYVAMGRALAEVHRDVPGFRDPVALELLPDDCRAVVDGIVGRRWPRSRREAQLAVIASVSERLIAPRTVEIDDALRGMPPGHQLVIVGAGLDGRAYRMSHLSESVVFEVDHPASQGLKRERAAHLAPCCKEVRYVPLDFSADGRSSPGHGADSGETLSGALARAGHSPAIATAWLFEGVITYLRLHEVEGAIAAMASRSAPGSAIMATYNRQNWVRRLFSRVTAHAGEPHRVSFAPAAMARLLGRYGFGVVSDRDGLQRAQRLGIAARGGDRFLRFHHVVVARFA